MEDDPFLINVSQFTQLKALRPGPNGKCVVFKTKFKKRKILFKYSTTNDTARFLCDVKNLKSCVHPSLTHFEGYLPPNEENSCVIATSFIATTLEETLRKIGAGEKVEAFGPTQIVNIAVGLSAGLKFLHSQNIVHGNLKPSNVLVDKLGKPLISDFYLALSKDSESRHSFNEGKTFENDVASFGSILYEIFSKQQLTQRISYGAKGKPSIPSSVPPFISSLVLACWSDNPSMRPNAFQIFSLLSNNLLQIQPEQDISQTRGYLSMLLSFERERLISMYGDAQCAQNFGKFLIESSSSLSYQIMGTEFLSMGPKDDQSSSLSIRPGDSESVRKRKKKLRRAKQVQEQIQVKDDSSSNSSPQGSSSTPSTPVPAPLKLKTALPRQKTPKRTKKISKIEKPESFTEDVYEAAQIGDIASLKYHLYTLNFNPTQTNSSGQTLMHIAAQAGQTQVLQLLITFPKVSLDATADWGRTPLHYAAESGQINAVKFIVSQKGGSIGPSSDDGRTPLHDAAGEGQLEVVEFLITCFDVNINKKDENGYCVLHYAAESGHANVVSALCSAKGINLNEKDEEGKTALHYSAGEGRLDVVDILINTKGININAKDAEGKTPLHYASLLEQTDMINKLLSAKGIDINSKDDYGQTAYDLATNPEIKALLVSKPKK